MTLSEANKIVRIWGAYLEYCQERLHAVFTGFIPESLLPYPAKTIEQALNIIAKHYHDKGDYEKSEMLRQSHRCLALYVGDEMALGGAVQAFSMPEVKDKVISNMKKVQEDWVSRIEPFWEK